MLNPERNNVKVNQTPSMCHLIRPQIRLGALLVGIGLLACPFRPARVDETPESDPPQPIEAGEMFLFQYPADGQWHPSPYVAVHGAQLIIRPTGSARGLSDKALRCRIGRISQLIRGEQPFKITEPGRMHFKVEPRFAANFQGFVSVQIERIK